MLPGNTPHSVIRVLLPPLKMVKLAGGSTLGVCRRRRRELPADAADGPYIEESCRRISCEGLTLATCSDVIVLGILDGKHVAIASEAALFQSLCSQQRSASLLRCLVLIALLRQALREDLPMVVP